MRKHYASTHRWIHVKSVQLHVYRHTHIRSNQLSKQSNSTTPVSGPWLTRLILSAFQRVHQTTPLFWRCTLLVRALSFSMKASFTCVNFSWDIQVKRQRVSMWRNPVLVTLKSWCLEEIYNSFYIHNIYSVYSTKCFKGCHEQKGRKQRAFPRLGLN